MESEMDLATMSRVLWLRRRLRRHESWPREQILTYQRRRLKTLRRFAVNASPFYTGLHSGLVEAPLRALPPLTKADLMNNFDRIVTDPAITLADVETYLAGLGDNRRYRGRYWVSATSGSTGRRSIIPHDGAEWAMVIAGYARANEWAGIRAGPRRPIRMAVVSSTTSWHQSSRVAATVRSPFVDSERLDAASPLAAIVDRLNTMQPQVLVGYASMIAILAGEQLAGQLRIAPRAVNSSSEVLTADARRLAIRAWQVEPFDVYAATETGGVAAECHHHRMHLFDDLIITEVVDHAYRPVPVGEAGDRLLVTVLFSRTVPLIRYELTDRLRLTPEPCPCGLPLQPAAAVEGRTDDALTLPGRSGAPVRIHPVLFHRVLDLLDAVGWQVRHDPDRLHILVAHPGPGFDPDQTTTSLHSALSAAGARPIPVIVSVVDTIPAGAAGKRPPVFTAHPGLPPPGTDPEATP
jgi:phenylacetate-CoA ligase